MQGKEVVGFEGVDKFAHGDLFEFLSKSFAYTEVAGQRVIQQHEDLSRQGDGMDSSRRGAGEPHGHRAGGSADKG